MILTTAAKETELLGERARQSEGFGANRCPVYVDGARAQAWATASGAEEAKRLVVEHEASTRRNAIGLVLGAGKRRSSLVPGQQSLASMWGRAKKRKPDDSDADAAAPPRPKVEAKAPAEARADPEPGATAAPPKPEVIDLT